MAEPVSSSPAPPAIDSDDAIARDVAAVGRISAVPAMLRVICNNTGMGFAAVARVTGGTWTACAVQDDIQFGLKVGGRLDVNTTLCIEARAARRPVVIDHASLDPLYAEHHTPRLYRIESYISVPIVLPDGEYFGNLCAIDPRPAVVSGPRTVAMFETFAEVIALQLDSERRHEAMASELAGERATAQLREEFIAVLGHDLRSPLAAVGASADVLARRTEEPQVAAIGRRLQATTRRMARLIDDVMDFARGRLGGGLGIALAAVDDLGGALREVLGELRAAHPDRMVFDDLTITGHIHCDRARVQQLLSNLVSNALTHGAADHPVLVEGAIEGEYLVLSVSNRGDPIPAEDLPKVLAPYWRSPASLAGGGLGLGLYICSQIVRAHGGRLHVTSSAEDGTTFVAHLPTGR